MKPRATTALYQTASRAWLTLAGLSLFLPVRWREGIWLPLHLALAGAISTAISGAMQNFMLALTATPAPPGRLVKWQFALVTAGVTMIAVGMPTTTPWLTASGGAAFVGAMAILAWMLWRAWHRALNKRHALPMAAYAAAVAFITLGGSLGALMGGHAVTGALYLNVRRAHMTVNVLGWASLTVVGTMITLLPTVLRVRMPPTRGRVTLGLLVAGLLVQLAGWISDLTLVLALGGIAYAVGALGFVASVASVLRVQRRWAIPAAAFHMLAGVAWFVGGSVGLAVALADGPVGFDRFREVFLTAFIGGWLLQVLLGAWSFLLPMGQPGPLAGRLRGLAVFEFAAPVQVILLNAGLLLMAANGSGWIGSGPARAGVGIAAVGATIALGKTWLFPVLGSGHVDTDRARAVWGG